MKYLSIIFLTIIFLSCNDSNYYSSFYGKKLSQKHIDSLITVNKDNMVFLNFWPGMSILEFKHIISMENKRGTLNCDTLYLTGMFPKEYDSYQTIMHEKKLPFHLSHVKGRYIELNYYDETWASYSDPNANNDTPFKIQTYTQNFIDSLISLYDNKYVRIKLDSNIHKYSWNHVEQIITPYGNKYKHNWIDGNRIISLDYKNSYCKLHSDHGGARVILGRNKEKELFKIAECEISILYNLKSNFDTLLKEQKERFLREKFRKEEKKIEKQELIKTIKKRNEDLI